MTTPELLAALDDQGIHLTANGDRLVYDAPAGAMTAELRDLLREQKGALLAFLGGEITLTREPQPETHTDRELRRFSRVAVETVHGLTDPAYLAIMQQIAAQPPQKQATEPTVTGIPAGWLPRRWVAELRRLAECCETVRPDRAHEHRQEADRIETELGHLTP